MNVVRTAFFFSLFLVWGLLPAQPQNVFFHRLTVENGLSQANNKYVFRDSRGFVWISSLDGVNRFDGQKVRVWKPDPRDSAGLAGSNVQSNFFEDRDGNIWFCTYEALNCYVQREDRFRNFPLQDAAGIQMAGLHAFHLDASGRLWLLARQQFLYFFDTRAHRFKGGPELFPGVQSAQVAPDRGREVRFVFAYGFSQPGMQVTEFLPGGRIRQYRVLHGLEGQPTVFVRKCLSENDTLLWIACREGFGTLNPATRKWTPCPLEFGQSPLDAFDICPFDTNHLLLAGGAKGIFLFDKTARKLTARYPLRRESRDAVPDNASSAFLFPGGDVFIAEPTLGLCFANLNKNKFTTYLGRDNIRPDVQGKQIRALAQDGAGNTWCLTMHNELVVFDPAKRMVAWHKPDAGHPDSLLVTEPRNLFIDRKNRVWILTWAGLELFDPLKKSFRRLSGPEQIFLYGLELADGRMLLTAFNGGMYEVRESGEHISFVRIPTIDATKAYTTLFQDKNGRLFASCELTKIVVIDTAPPFSVIAEIPVKGEINAWYEPPGGDCYWIASSYGLVRLYKKDFRFSIWSEKDGLPDQNLYAVLPDRQGQLWLSSNKGVFRFNPVDSTVHAFSLADGLPALEFNTFAWLHKPDGGIWLGSMGGICAFHPDSISYLPPPARVLVTGIVINGQLANHARCALTGTINPMEIRRLVLPYRENTLDFNFTVPEFADPGQLRYRYKLEGFDQRWTAPGTTGAARFASLPPGHYTLLLEACNSDGIWTPRATRLDIRIDPPFWQTWWFLSGCVLGFAALVWYFTRSFYRRREQIQRLRMEKELAVEKERNRISRDLHDDLGSGLGAIGLLSDIALSKTGDAEMRAEVGKIAESAHELSAKVREIIWAANAQNDTMEKLISYLHQYAVNLFEGSGIELLARLPLSLPATPISGDRRRALFLAFKEALYNIVKHAQATRIDIEFVCTLTQLEIRINDNGRGFDPAAAGPEASGGNGLVNMRRRMEDIGGAFLIESGQAGTTVVFQVKV